LVLVEELRRVKSYGMDGRERLRAERVGWGWRRLTYKFNGNY
jgi:hypothetical protein